MRTLGSPLFALLVQAAAGGSLDNASASTGIVNLLSRATPLSIAILVALMVLSVWSWGIFLYKWWTFRRAAKQSAQFLEVFRRSNKFSEVQAVCRSLVDSPLVGLFHSGYADLDTQLRTDRPDATKPPATAARTRNRPGPTAPARHSPPCRSARGPTDRAPTTR